MTSNDSIGPVPFKSILDRFNSYLGFSGAHMPQIPVGVSYRRPNSARAELYQALIE